MLIPLKLSEDKRTVWVDVDLVLEVRDLKGSLGRCNVFLDFSTSRMKGFHSDEAEVYQVLGTAEHVANWINNYSPDLRAAQAPWEEV